MARAPVDVRRAALADVEDLVTLWGRAREELIRGSRGLGAGAPEQLRDRVAAALEGGGMQVVIARWSGRPAGYALMRLATLTPLLDGPSLHVEHLFVDSEFRRHGVARALLAAVAGTAERHGVDQIVTSAPPSSRDTHRFLARLGFSPLVVRRVVGTAVLRRRLAGESRRGALEDLLSRRRSMRARTGWGGNHPVTDPLDEPVPADDCPGDSPAPTAEAAQRDTLELPRVGVSGGSVDDPVGLVPEPARRGGEPSALVQDGMQHRG